MAQVNISDLKEKTSLEDSDVFLVEGTDATYKITKKKLEEGLNVNSSSESGGSVDLSAYQKITDNTLNTTNKTVTGAINEISSQFQTIANNFSTEQTNDYFIIKYNDKEIAKIPINSTIQDDVFIMYDFSKIEVLDDDIFSMYIDDINYTFIENGLLNLKVKFNSATSQEKNYLSIDKFESDYFRVDVEAIYSDYEKAWDCICLWNYGSKWTDEGNIGIWSSIGGETDVFEQSQPSGNPNTVASCIIHAGDNKDSYTHTKVVGSQNIIPGELHKYSCIVEGCKRTFLYDDVVICAYTDDTFRSTSEFAFNRNMLALPVWVQLWSQATQASTTDVCIMKIKSIKFSTVDGSAVVLPTKVNLSNDYVTNEAPVGVKLFMIKEVLPANATNKYTTWTSSNPSVATVTECGLVETLTEGTTIISAETYNGIIGTYSLTVNNNADIDCKKIKLQSDVLNVSEGGKANIPSCSLYPAYTSKNVTYESSDTSIATVTNNGVVTGVKIGTCQITVACGSTSEIVTCSVLDPTGLLNTIVLEDTNAHTGTANVDFTSDYTIKFDITENTTGENGFAWNCTTATYKNAY